MIFFLLIKLKLIFFLMLICFTSIILVWFNLYYSVIIISDNITITVSLLLYSICLLRHPLTGFCYTSCIISHRAVVHPLNWHLFPNTELSLHNIPTPNVLFKSFTLIFIRCTLNIKLINIHWDICFYFLSNIP